MYGKFQSGEMVIMNSDITSNFASEWEHWEWKCCRCFGWCLV